MNRTVTETVSLKVLARAVLARDSHRDNNRDTAAEAAGKSGAADILAPLPWHERAAPPIAGEPSYEQPCSARRGRVEDRNGVLLHFCFDCGRWGAYGYGVRLLAGKSGRWYCRAHRPHETTNDECPARSSIALN